jgi:hypothetical protein
MAKCLIGLFSGGNHQVAKAHRRESLRNHGNQWHPVRYTKYIKAPVHWQSLLVKTSVVSQHDFLFLIHLGQATLIEIILSVSVPPKVAKASNSGVFEASNHQQFCQQTASMYMMSL